MPYMHARPVVGDITLQSNTMRLHNNGIIFKNVHSETPYKKFAFSGPQNAIVV